MEIDIKVSGRPGSERFVISPSVVLVGRAVN